MNSQLKSKLISSYKEEMVAFLKSQPEHFNEAIELAISDDQPFAWRSAFVLSSCMDDNDARVKNYIKRILACIKNKNDGHQRELLKILYRMKLSDKEEGMVFDICIRLWEQISKDPSVRMTALKFILKIAKDHYELLNEITPLMQDQYLELLSPGVKKSIRKMIKEIIDRD
ncbi:MAG: hypothetical protein MUF28_05705 [Ignavibacterium sp.]|jgi:hypothetical protein|nr:hypothetical protein [Ignavibacterium sp.]